MHKNSKERTKSFVEFVCRNCHSDRYFPRYIRGSIFSPKEFSHYVCENCNHEFREPKTISTIEDVRWEISKILCDYFNNNFLNYKELKEKLREYNVNIPVFPSRKMCQDKTKRQEEILRGYK